MVLDSIMDRVEEMEGKRGRGGQGQTQDFGLDSRSTKRRKAGGARGAGKAGGTGGGMELGDLGVLSLSDEVEEEVRGVLEGVLEEVGGRERARKSGLLRKKEGVVGGAGQRKKKNRLV